MSEEAASLAEAFTAALDAIPADEVQALERQAAADLLDRSFYLETNPAVAEAGMDPVDHFCRFGWRELRKPRRDFDVWWYWANHLDPSQDRINPLLHYAVLGREAGLEARPDPRPRSEGVTFTPGQVRRAILFAAYDAGGLVDDATIHFVTELARHGDVFFLADCYLHPDELAKLADVTAGAWSVRHGAYDFGSYSMLATDLVGWSRLEEYDEVLFVNDSCYLVRPLDEVFARMDATAADWWGLQATKGLAGTVLDDSMSHFAEPIRLEDVVNERVIAFEDSPVYDFHVGSYFLAFRRPVLDDPVFRQLIGSVARQPSKLLIILKYEVGLTHLLLGRGHRMATFMEHLYPFHPIFTEWALRLIDSGFPLLKQYFLEHNHYQTPGLAAWREKLLALVPEARVDLMQERLDRTGDHSRIARSFAVRPLPNGTVTVPHTMNPDQFWEADEATPKDNRQWTFVVDPTTHRLSESNLALLHEAARSGGRKLTVLTRAIAFDTSPYAAAASPVTTHPVTSPAGQQALLTSATVLVSGDPWQSVGVAMQTEHRRVVVTRDGFTAPVLSEAPINPDRVLPLARATALLSAGEMDLLLALPHHWPATYDLGWMTGLPAHDLLALPPERLPDEIRVDMDRLSTELAGRRLLLLAPSAFETATLTRAEADQLIADASRHDLVLGVRSVAGDLDRPWARLLGGAALDLSASRYAWRTAVLRSAAAVVSDDDGLLLDLIAHGIPCRRIGDGQAPMVGLRELAGLPTYADGGIDDLETVPAPRPMFTIRGEAITRTFRALATTGVAR
ncbi:rhamnan synthesis F family protein [Nocardioides sp. Kera G14]|uniref:rhamnan synthesis F family protein n=1 Tax=Nocardioides sp. Kera G14 TaxID=2884264 RepID=UPI001D11B925|nr:rhamnan synthesis F family protein [Nocardioides sp. Kera G14]UDY22666.1 hypothetical protein LH076_11350 [Nocardioides sp. Kera G14]